MRDIVLTSIYSNEGLPVARDQVNTYRGMDGMTAVYYKDGSVAFVKESFETVDKLLEGNKHGNTED